MLLCWVCINIWLWHYNFFWRQFGFQIWWHKLTSELTLHITRDTSSSVLTRFGNILALCTGTGGPDLRGGNSSLTCWAAWWQGCCHLQCATYWYLKFYGITTALLWPVPGGCSHLCVSEEYFWGECHYANSLSALGSTKAHLWIGQKYCVYHKKGTTTRRSFIILIQGTFIHPLHSFPYWPADLFTLLSHWLWMRV